MIGRLLFKEELGFIIKAIRLKRGYTLRQLSLRSHIALSFLSEIERGKKDPSSAIIAAIANGLGVEVSVLILEAGHRIRAFETIGEIPDFIPEFMLTGDSSDIGR